MKMHISECAVEVRYAETDQMGVVYHANYLIWMELGRTNLIKDLGLSYLEMEQEGVISPVVEIQTSYKKPMRYGDTAIIKTWIEQYSPVKTLYGYEISNQDGELSCIGWSTNVVVKRDSFRPISLKRMFPNWHEIYEENKK